MALVLNVRGIYKRLKQSLHVIEWPYSIKLHIRKAELADITQELLSTSHALMVACLLSALILLLGQVVLLMLLLVRLMMMRAVMLLMLTVVLEVLRVSMLVLVLILLMLEVASLTAMHGLVHHLVTYANLL